VNRSSRLPSAVVALFVAVVLAGCVEADETWTFDAKGGGTYALRVRWNAGLFARATALVGADAIRRLEGRGFPLRANQLRDTLAGLEGVEVTEVAEDDLEGGFRELRARVTFRRVQDLLAWEVLARRRLRLRREDGQAELAMDPLAHLPVLGPLVEAARDRGLSPQGDADGTSSDERLGLRPENAELLGAMLKPHLQKSRFRFRFEPPGPVTAVGGRPTPSEEAAASVEVSFADLVAGRDRRVRVRWRPLAFDVVHEVDHAGDPPSDLGDANR
jgi:hypothetical protein